MTTPYLCFFIFHIVYVITISLIDICLLPNYNFGREGDSINSEQEILHEHYIPAKYTYLYCDSDCHLAGVTRYNEFQSQEQIGTAFQ